MSITTLLRYWIGDRQAILAIASNRQALWIGALFVLSAGFAREYDGEDLLSEPWHLLLPLGASLLSSLVLFTITYGKILFVDPNRPSFLAAYRSFLTLFWMTAPLAWLYAIPYERFLSPAQALEANLWTLGLVALWRVVLMVRVVSVLMGYRVDQAFFLVLLFADVVAVLAILLIPRPVVSLMGGVRLTDSDRLILKLTFSVLFFGCLSLPVWLIGAVTELVMSKPAWQLSPPLNNQTVVPAGTVWVLALVSLAVWAPILPRTQAEQRLRTQVESDFRNGRISEGLARMTNHSPSDFPPHWEPPPRVGYGKENPPLLDVMEFILEHPPASWVQTMYVEKFGRYLGDVYGDELLMKPAEDIRRIIRLLRQLPEGPALVAEHRRALEYGLRDRPDLPKAELEQLKTLLGEDRAGNGNQKGD
jgi:hypothetical protein